MIDAAHAFFATLVALPIEPTLGGSPLTWIHNPDWWVAGFTAALFVATAGLWIFTALLWKTTRQAVCDGERNIKAAETAAEAALLNARAAIGVELPRLELDGVRFTSTSSPIQDQLRIGAFDIALKNHGRTTAHIIEYCLLTSLGDTLRASPNYPRDAAISAPIGAVALAGESFTISGRGKVLLSEGASRDVVTRQQLFWAFGYVAFRDFMGGHWRSKFCLLFVRQGDQYAFIDPGSYPSYSGHERYDPTERKNHAER